jgi:hypothetical protein
VASTLFPTENPAKVLSRVVLTAMATFGNGRRDVHECFAKNNSYVVLTAMTSFAHRSCDVPEWFFQWQ